MDPKPQFQGLRQPLEQWDRRHGSARLEPSDRRLAQTGSLCQFGLSDAEFLGAL